jgi:hypothetical protein
MTLHMTKATLIPSAEDISQFDIDTDDLAFVLVVEKEVIDDLLFICDEIRVFFILPRQFFKRFAKVILSTILRSVESGV